MSKGSSCVKQPYSSFSDADRFRYASLSYWAFLKVFFFTFALDSRLFTTFVLGIEVPRNLWKVPSYLHCMFRCWSIIFQLVSHPYLCFSPLLIYNSPLKEFWYIFRGILTARALSSINHLVTWFCFSYYVANCKHYKLQKQDT